MFSQLQQKKIASISHELQLSGHELKLRKQLQEELWAAAISHESLLRQKARTRWIKEKDCNSRLFHLIVNENRRHNMLRGLLVDGCWIDEPSRVKQEVHMLFKNKFKEAERDKPRLDGVGFKVIAQQQNDSLVERFHEKEVKDAVWECGSEKCPKSDGLKNFGMLSNLLCSIFWMNSMLMEDF